jgi:hypothetical protein
MMKNTFISPKVRPSRLINAIPFVQTRFSQSNLVNNKVITKKNPLETDKNRF